MGRVRASVALGAAALVAMLLLAGCTPGTTDPAHAEATGTWGDPGTASAPSLVFSDDGSLSGTDGCNRLAGRWAETHGTVEFIRVASTEMACPDVDTWLSTLSSGSITGDTLTVLDAHGTRIGTLQRAAEDAPQATPSRSSTAAVGSWGDDRPGHAHVRISETGAVSGNDGCNSLTGTWAAADDDRVTFGPIASTLIGCDGIDQWLRTMASAEVSADTMTFFDADGARIGSLPRAD